MDVLMFLFKLGWKTKTTIPVLLMTAFLVFDVRLQVVFHINYRLVDPVQEDSESDDDEDDDDDDERNSQVDINQESDTFSSEYSLNDDIDDDDDGDDDDDDDDDNWSSQSSISERSTFQHTSDFVLRHLFLTRSNFLS